MMNKEELKNFTNHIRGLLGVDIHWSNEYLLNSYEKFLKSSSHNKNPKVGKNEVKERFFSKCCGASIDLTWNTTYCEKCGKECEGTLKQID